MSLEIVYTGFYDGKLQSITTGATGLVVPLDTVGVQTIDFPSGVPYSELVAPLNYTSTTNGVVLTGTVVPFVIPEPATAIALSGLPLVFLALRGADPGGLSAARRVAARPAEDSTRWGGVAGRPAPLWSCSALLISRRRAPGRGPAGRGS